MAREYYSIPEAAARLGISRIAVFKQVKKGRLEALRIGRNWAVPAAALERAALPEKAPVIPPPARRTVTRSGGRGALPSPALPPTVNEVPPPPAPDSELDSMGWD